MARYTRKKLFVDSEVQSSLVRRVIVYWVACMATLELLQLTWSIASGPQQPTFLAYFVHYNWPAVAGRLLIATILLVPIVWDVLSFSNRFAGPVFRMRRILRQVAQTGTIEQVRLRSGDYWHGMAEDLNSALARLAHSDAEVSAVAPESSLRAEQAEPDDAEWLADDFSPAR